jgi:hypothetical protein
MALAQGGNGQVCLRRVAKRGPRHAQYAAMAKYLMIVLAGLAVLTAAQPPAAWSQGGLDRRLAAAKRLECTFSVLGTGTWDKNVPAIKVTPAEIKANFFDINIDEGTAEAESAYGKSFISVRYESGYLHIMQMSDAGPLYVTTVLARAAGEGKLMAVHTRIEYSPTIIPGFTSRPEMYLGTCTIAANPG